MGENENKDTNVKATIDAVTGLLNAIPVYQDTLQPAAKQIGNTLETASKLVNIALFPVRGLVWGYEKIENFVISSVSEKLKNVPEENIVTPPASIAGPAFEALRFSGEDVNLRELYTNLLASAMDSSTQHFVHPAYIEILKNICSDEALLLQVFTVNNSYPLIDLITVFPNNEGKKIIYKNFSDLDKKSNLKNESLLPTYIDNLNRLGLTEIPEDKYLTQENVYDALEKQELIELARKGIEAINGKLEIDRKLLRLTNFGKYFIDNVVKDKL